MIVSILYVGILKNRNEIITNDFKSEYILLKFFILKLGANYFFN